MGLRPMVEMVSCMRGRMVCFDSLLFYAYIPQPTRQTPGLASAGERPVFGTRRYPIFNSRNVTFCLHATAVVTRPSLGIYQILETSVLGHSQKLADTQNIHQPYLQDCMPDHREISLNKGCCRRAIIREEIGSHQGS